MFDPGDDSERAAAITDELAAVPHEVFIAGASSVLDVDVAAATLAVRVPALFVASARPWLDLNRVHELRPDWFLGRTVGAGHFHQVLVPDQVNAMIARFLDCVGSGVTAAPNRSSDRAVEKVGNPLTRDGFIDAGHALGTYDWAGLACKPVDVRLERRGKAPATGCGYFVRLQDGKFVPMPKSGKPVIGKLVGSPEALAQARSGATATTTTAAAAP